MRLTIRQLIPVLALALASHANATVYNYAFGTNAGGQFTTGDAAADPGYFLLTRLTVTSFNDYRVGVISPVNLTGTRFDQPGSAYNPTTGAFLNHANGETYQNFGGITVEGTFADGSAADIRSYSFERGSSSLELDSGPTYYLSDGRLTVTVAPEPASLAALAGVALVALRRRRSRH